MDLRTWETAAEQSHTERLQLLMSARGAVGSARAGNS